MTIYYFSPNCNSDILERISSLTKEECEYEYQNSSSAEVSRYSNPQGFEFDFNAECISDLGYIRIFE